MHDIVIIGGGGHAKVVISIIKKLPHYSIIGYTDREDRGDLLGVPYLGDDNKLAQTIKGNPGTCAVLGLGMLNNSGALKRKNLYDLVSSLNYELPSIISPDAVINEDVVIGNGTVVMDGVVVNSGTNIGFCTILNTCCSVDHDCQIGHFVHVAPGVTLSGGVNVRERVLIGTGAVVTEQITIEDDIIIGAGAVVMKDCSVPGTYLGIPAERIK